MSNTWTPSGALTDDNSARFYARQSARVQLLASIDPTLAQLPQGLTGVANLNIDANNLYGQIAAYKGAATSQLSRDQLEGYSPGLQRSLFASSDTVTQQALAAAGYQPPQANPSGSSSLFGDVMGFAGEAVGDVIGAVHNAIGPVLDPTLALAGEVGQVPADMYRAIRTQPEWVQQLALAGAVAAAVATGGATAPALFGAQAGATMAGLSTGAAAIGGGFATAGIVNSLQGNWDFWGQAWQHGNAGERVWAPHTLSRARDQIGTDGNLLELAKTMAYDDPLELAKQFGESNDSSEINRLNLVERLASRAGQRGTPEFAAAYSGLEKITADGSFKSAVQTLRDGKISFGRDIASALGLDVGSAPYNIISGAGDAFFQWTTDPILAAGSVLKTSRAIRFGVNASLASDVTEAGNRNWQAAIDSTLKNPAVRAQSEQIAGLMTTPGGMSTAYRKFPQMRNLLGSMNTWKAAERPATEWSADLVEDFYRSQTGSMALASGKGLTSRHGIIEIPHLNPLGDTVAQLRNQFGQAINFLDDKNISFKVDLGAADMAPEYVTQAQMGGFTSPFVHFVDGIPFVNKVAESAATLAKTLITKVPHDGFLSLTDQGAHGADMVNQARQFVDVMRVAGIPSAVRDAAFDSFITAPNIGMRRQVIESFYRTVAEQSGLNTTTEGRKIMERFIDHTNQAYVGGRNQASFAQDASSLIGIPDIQSVRQAIAKMSILNKTLNLADAHWATAAVGQIWKPAVLLRVGFIPRIVGDEMANFIAKHGLFPLVQSVVGKAAVAPDDALARHVSWIDGLSKTMTDGFTKATMGHLDATPVQQLTHSILLQYSRGIRHLANNGLFGIDNTTGLGKLLAPEGTLRGLAFAGIPDSYRRRALDFLEVGGLPQAAYLSRLSSKHNPMLADINDVDPLRRGLKLGPDGEIEETVMVNPGNSRQFVTDMSPEQHAIQAHNQIQSLRTRRESQLFDEFSLTRPGPYVTAPLDAAGHSPEELLNVLSTQGAALKTEERLAISHLMVGANNSQPGVSTYLENRATSLNNYANSIIRGDIQAPDDVTDVEAFLNGLMHRASQLQDYAVKVTQAPSRSAALDVFGDKVSPEMRRALGNGRVADSWMARIFGNGEPIGGGLVRHESYQEYRADLTRHFETAAYTDQRWQSQFNALEDANKTAITGIPVAHPPAHGTVRLWAPHLSPESRTAMDELVQTAGDLGPDNVTAWLHTKGVTVDDDIARVVAKWAQQEKRITLESGTGWNPGAATAMTIEDPRVARAASDALARAGGQEAGGIAELQVPISGMGRFRPNHGVGGVSNPLRYGGVQGYAIDPNFVSKDAYQVFGPDFPHAASHSFFQTGDADDFHRLFTQLQSKDLTEAERRSIAVYQHFTPAELRAEDAVPISPEKFDEMTRGVWDDMESGKIDLDSIHEWIRENRDRATDYSNFEHLAAKYLGDGVPGASVEQAIQESVQAQINGVLERHAGPLHNPVESGPATLKPNMWWNGPTHGRVELDSIGDRTSPIMIGDDGQVIVDAALANADLAAGLPYWRGNGQLQQLSHLDTSARDVPLPGRSVTTTTDAATINPATYRRTVTADEFYDTYEGEPLELGPNMEAFANDAHQMAQNGERIILNVNHRGAKDATEWLDALGVDYQLTSKSGKMPRWAQNKLVGTQPVSEIPVVDAHLGNEVAHATIDEDGNRVIRIDREKVALMKGQLDERAYLRETGVDVDATRPGVTTGWAKHPSFNFMRPEDLYDALRARGKTFDDWVLAHEQGHHAMGHIRYQGADESYEEYTAGRLAKERQADRWAADHLGIELPHTDPRSLRLQRAATQAGADIDKLHILMERTGADAYKEMLGNLESARLAYGDNLEGDMAALRHLQADWDLPVTGQGRLKVTGADINDVPQPLWPVMAPAVIDELHRARGAVASPGDITGVPEELLPRRAIKTVYAQRDDPSAFHKLTDWGFDKVGGAIDKLFRQPAAMYYYQRARAMTDVLEQSWRDPMLFGEGGTFRRVAEDHLAGDTRKTVEQMSKGERADLVTAGMKMGMTAPTAQQVARTQSADGVAWLHGQGEHALADTLVRSKPLVTVDEHMETLLDRARHGDFDWARESQVPTIKAALANADTAAETAKSLAVQRTVADMTPFIHDPRVRTQFQQHLNNIVPFWFAEDQFMRRWAGAMIYDPSILRKAQLLHQGLKSSGLVTTDAQGNDAFVYPASAAFAEVVAKLPFLHDSVPITNAFTGSLAASVPGIENFGLPSVTPFITVPLNQVASIFPEMRPGVAALTGGFDRGVVRALVPTSLMRFVDALGSNDSDAKMASAMMTAAAIMEAHGQGLPDNADAATQEAYLDRLRNHARSTLLAQAMWGFLVPAPPTTVETGSTHPLGLDVNFLSAPQETLRPEYLNLVRNLGVEAGTARYLELYPDNTPDDLVNRNIAYSKGQTQRESGAPLPPTVAAEQFLNTNRTWMEQYRFAGPWLLPAPTADDAGQAIDQTAYKDQMNVGFRRLEAPTDFVANLKFATGATSYFDQIDQFKTMREAAKSTNGRAQVDAVETLYKQQFYATHPLFAQQLQSSDGRTRRANVLNEMRLALTDPATPASPALDSYRDMMEAWDSYAAFVTQYAGRSGRFVDNAKKTAKNNLIAWMEQYVTEHPDAGSFWAGILKPEVGA